MMDLKAKFKELQLLLNRFEKNEASIDELQSFAWNVIDYFTDTPSIELPDEEEFEKPFWYAIWQVQHLCDEEHIKDGTAKRELSEALAYLKKDKEMPVKCVGRRP